MWVSHNYVDGFAKFKTYNVPTLTDAHCYGYADQPSNAFQTTTAECSLSIRVQRPSNHNDAVDEKRPSATTPSRIGKVFWHVDRQSMWRFIVVVIDPR